MKPTMLTLVFISLKIIVDNKRNILKPASINKKHYYALNISKNCNASKLGIKDFDIE